MPRTTSHVLKLSSRKPACIPQAAIAYNMPIHNQRRTPVTSTANPHRQPHPESPTHTNAPAHTPASGNPQSAFRNPQSEIRIPQSPLLPPAALALALLALLAPNPTAHALVNIARGTLDLQTTLAGTYESYFIGSPANDPDWYYSVAPLLQFNRNAGRATLDATAGITFTEYDQNTQYNSSYPTATLNINLPTQPGARLDGSLSLSYLESNEVDYTLNDRIPVKTLNATLALNYRLGEKTSLHETLSYAKYLRDGAGYSDQEIWGNRIGLLYTGFLRGASLSLDYDFNKTDTSGDNYLGVPLHQTYHAPSLTLSRPIYGEVKGSLTYGYQIFDRGAAETPSARTRDSSSFIGIGIDGPFLPPSRFPKLTSHASLYYRSATSAGLNDNNNDTLTGSLSLSWAARPRTQLTLNARRDTTLNAADLSVTNTSAGFGVTEHLGAASTLAGTLNYNWSEYKGIDRDDDYLSARLTAAHTINKHWQTSLAYEYQHNKNTSAGPQPTPQPGRDYDRHIVTLSLTARF